MPPSILLNRKIVKLLTKFSDQRERIEDNKAAARIGWRPCRLSGNKLPAANAPNRAPAVPLFRVFVLSIFRDGKRGKMGRWALAPIGVHLYY